LRRTEFYWRCGEYRRSPIRDDNRSEDWLCLITAKQIGVRCWDWRRYAYTSCSHVLFTSSP